MSVDIGERKDWRIERVQPQPGEGATCCCVATRPNGTTAHLFYFHMTEIWAVQALITAAKSGAKAPEQIEDLRSANQGLMDRMRKWREVAEQLGGAVQAWEKWDGHNNSFNKELFTNALAALATLAATEPQRQEV